MTNPAKPVNDENNEKKSSNIKRFAAISGTAAVALTTIGAASFVGARAATITVIKNANLEKLIPAGYEVIKTTIS